MELILFNLIPFILMVALPAFTLSLFSLLIVRSIKKDVSTVVIFPLSVILLAILANSLWDTYIFKVIYYEWDRIFLPYTLISHESPSIDGQGTWYAQGWNKVGLDLIWFAITIMVYLGATIASLLVGLLHKNTVKETIKSALTCFFIASLITILIFIFELI